MPPSASRRLFKPRPPGRYRAPERPRGRQRRAPRRPDRCGDCGTGRGQPALAADLNVQLSPWPRLRGPAATQLETCKRTRKWPPRCRPARASHVGFNAYHEPLVSGLTWSCLHAPHFRPIHLHAAVEAGSTSAEKRWPLTAGRPLRTHEPRAGQVQGARSPRPASATTTASRRPSSASRRPRLARSFALR
jgi:hypothetical protein